MGQRQKGSQDVKIRSGHVSNSSSSSFIIALKPFECAEDIKQQLFGDDFGEHFSHPYSRKGASTTRIAETVFRDARKVTRDEMIDEVDHGWFDGEPKYPMHALKMPEEESRRIIDEHYKARKDAAAQRVDNFIQTLGGGYECYVVMYSDNDGPFNSLMEHGGVFNDIPNIVISHH